VSAFNSLLAIQAAEATETAGDGLADWIGAAITLGIAIGVATGARWAIRRLGTRANTVTSTVQIMARLIFALIVAVGVYVALQTIGVDLGPVLAGAGIASVAIAFALQDIAENYIAGVLMGFRNPFVPGDQIRSGNHEGTVEELTLRYTTICRYDGVKVLLPNGQVLKNPIENLTTNGDRRSDFSIGVGYGTDLERARAVIAAAVDDCAGVRAIPAPEIWVEDLAASWVTIRIRYWHAPRAADMWNVRNTALIAVYDAATEADINMPFERQIIELVTD